MYLVDRKKCCARPMQRQPKFENMRLAQSPRPGAETRLFAEKKTQIAPRIQSATQTKNKPKLKISAIFKNKKHIHFQYLTPKISCSSLDLAEFLIPHFCSRQERKSEGDLEGLWGWPQSHRKSSHDCGREKMS